MKRALSTVLVLGFLLLGAASSQAFVYTIQPTPADLLDLNHSAAFTWGFGWNPQMEITGASLTFRNIYDYTVEEDFLYLHLLNLGSQDVGVHKLVDETAGDFFEGQGYLIDVWSDPAGGGPGVDITITFSDEAVQWMNQFAADDGFLGIGVDPDCHYYNDGVELNIETPVPEPATMILFGLGVLGFGIHRKFRH